MRIVPAKGVLFDVLDFDGLVSNPALVRPGVPDGSGLYNAMVTRRMPPLRISGNDGGEGGRGKARGKKGSSAVAKLDWRELAAVRDWISSLESVGDPCDGRSLVSLKTVRAEIDRYVEQTSSEVAARTRFISMAHLDGSCASRSQLGNFRAGVSVLLNGLSWGEDAVRLDRVGRTGVLLAVDLDALGWPVSRWDWLASQFALGDKIGAGLSKFSRSALGSDVPVLPADWLAHSASSPSVYSGLMGLPRSVQGLRAKLSRIYGQPNGVFVSGVGVAGDAGDVVALSRRYDDDLDLSRAASDLWIARGEFLAMLEKYDGPHVGIARRLRQGVVTRGEFEQLAAVLIENGRGRAAKADDEEKPKSDKLPVQWRLSLWSDKVQYNAGDEATIYAQSTQDCRLSVVGVDGDGLATVLFPNGFARDNLITGGQVFSLPVKGAPYRLRFNEPGIEMIVGTCARPNVDTLPGVHHNFDAQQFTVIGNWRGHVNNTFILESETYLKGRVPRRARKRRRRGRSRRSRRPSWFLEDRAPYVGAREAILISIGR